MTELPLRRALLPFRFHSIWAADILGALVGGGLVDIFLYPGPDSIFNRSVSEETYDQVSASTYADARLPYAFSVCIGSLHPQLLMRRARRATSSLLPSATAGTR